MGNVLPDRFRSTHAQCSTSLRSVLVDQSLRTYRKICVEERGGVMKGLRFLAVLAATSVATAPAFASFKTGNDLLEYCSPKASSYESAVCLGYIEGIADSTLGSTICVDELKHLKVAHLLSVVINDLKNHPERRHLNAASLVAGALDNAFPCKENR
jgi:Rap1a immunity proteins